MTKQTEIAADFGALDVRALLDSEQRFRGMAESAPVGIYIADADGALTYVNPYLAAIAGLSAEECLGDGYLVAVLEQDRGHLRRSWLAAVGEATVFRDEYRLRQRDGSIVWVLETAQPMRDLDGNLSGYIGIVTDVTALKLAEQQLAYSEERFAQIFETANVGIAQADGEDRLVAVNPKLCQMLGYSAEELLGRPSFDLPHPDDREESRRMAELARWQDIEAHRGERRYLRKDGSVIWVDVCVRTVRDEHGRAKYTIGVIMDVSERRRIEERQRLDAAAFESTRDGVMITNLDGRIRAANRSLREAAGYTENELLGNTPAILRSGRHDEGFYRAMWVSLKRTGRWQGEIWNRRKNGEIFPVWLSISAVYDEQGQPTHYVAIYTDISQLKQSEEQLERLAHFDPLTELPNRLLLQSRLEHAIDQARRRGRSVAVLFIDLDNFKKVNDSLGHIVGDELLVAVSKRLGERVRDEDTLARLGGDEFVVLLESISRPEQAATVARDLTAALAQPFTLSSGHELYVEASVGISVFPDDDTTPSELLRDADTAMYRAKDAGGGRFLFFTGEMSAEVLAELELENALRQALERNELLLYFQPTVDVRSGRISGAEALLRWQRNGGVMVSPKEFIPIAEKMGLIVSIGRWVIDSACRQYRDWRDSGLPDFYVAINVSARQFHSGDLKSDIESALRKYDMPPELLVLELTESMLMQRPEEATEILQRLKRVGVKLSLDDFGTGFSSLAYLMRFPMDTLKIDASFVRGIGKDPSAPDIISSVIELAHRMRMHAVAEGVETAKQYAYLRDQGCDAMQGYFFSRPVPAEEFAELCRRVKTV